MSLETLGEHACFGGRVGYYRHDSSSTRTSMRFSVFTPPQARERPVPVLYFLAGLTCTEETFMVKAGAQRIAAELGLMLVAPDTSPRGIELPGDREHWDFGVGAGFYLDAVRAPWATHYRMASYVVHELPTLVARHFPADAARAGLFGHSMGGHGALTLGLTHRDRYRSISAFAPIVAPMQCPWGVKAFSGYLGEDRAAWARHDATEIVRALDDATLGPPILIDQGLADPFLERELKPQLFEAACDEAGYPLILRRHAGYDHGYYFIATFVADHLRHHANALLQ
ncbi:MAG: S-formylglutathione hydrolase [Steroidobacteraceae bacterium]